MRDVSFLLGEIKWHYQNVKILFLLVQNVKKETMHQAKILQLIQKELKSLNSVLDVVKEQLIKKPNNYFGFDCRRQIFAVGECSVLHIL